MMTLLNPDKTLILEQYQLIPYDIKFSAPWSTSSNSMNSRRGLLVKFSIQNPGSSLSFSIIGECAPMTEIGTESLSQASDLLQHKLEQQVNKPINESLLTGLDNFPACRFALESILLHLQAKQKQISIAQLLAPGHHLAKTIKINAMLGTLDKKVLARAKQAESEGFNCLKFKLGLESLEVEIRQIKVLLQELSNTTLIRLDANKKWTLAETELLLDHLEPFAAQIDCLEEPLAKYSTENYHYLQSKTQIPLALDESFNTTISLTAFPVKSLVLKPMAQGGIIKTYQLARQAQKNNIKTIITSSIETGYGLWLMTYLCAALNNGQFHGLATASWLDETLIKPPEIKHGSITL